MALDALDSIMGMLRGKGAVDPGHAAERKARLKDHRQGMGLSPGVSPQMLPPRQPLRQPQATLRGVQPQHPVQGQQTAVASLIDQLNEAIITTKIQLQQEPLKDKQNQLKRLSETLRQQILILGGDPIRADETIEQGLTKLQGTGFIDDPPVGRGGLL